MPKGHNYTFTFTNSGGTNATITSAISSHPGYSTTCVASLSKDGGTCTISGTYTPTSSTPSLQSVIGTFSYAEGSPIALTTSTTVGNTAGVQGLIITALPPVMVDSTSASYGFKFCNGNPADTSITITSSSVVPTAGTVTLDPVASNCTASSTLPGGGACCQIVGTLPTYSYTAPATTPSNPNVSLTATLNFTYLGAPGVATISSDTVITTSLPTDRIFNVSNYCAFDIWVSMSGSAVPAGDYTSPCTCPGGAATCTPGSCPAGASCNVAKGCFWQNYPPSTGNNKLVKYSGSGSPATLQFTIPSSIHPDSTTKWSGGISASTGCNGTDACLQAGCGNAGGSTSCAPGTGFDTPSSQAEFTLILNNGDSYDVTAINGVHIPIQMSATQPALVSNYDCGAAGGNPATPGFGACIFDNAVLPTHQYYWVLPPTGGGAGTCTIAAPGTCASGYLCGITSPPASASFDVACGEFLGFFTGDQICGSANVPTTIRQQFECDVPLSALTTPTGPTFSPTPPGHTSPSVLQDLMLCSVAAGYTGPIFSTCYAVYDSSTYSPQQISSCCGCVDWWTQSYNGAPVLANSDTDTCAKYGPNNSDPVWDAHIKNTLLWLKAACPSDYVYPFDDKTSTFACSNNGVNSPNTVGYDIIFCPNQDSGLPTGITEGRSTIAP
ncbi:MAG: thaumatin domain-containing protein [Gammaproteobacteria bacterium]|nr:thaumatin domain-containing protein [Gammaproteobacteria bacterium]